jgi:hypothetical protein
VPGAGQPHPQGIGAPPKWVRPRGGSFGGHYLTSTELFGVLLSEPYSGLTPERILELDRWQVVALYFVERDKRGNVVATGRRPAPTERERFFRFWRGKALPAWRVLALWEETQRPAPPPSPAREGRRAAEARRLAEVRALRGRGRG